MSNKKLYNWGRDKFVKELYKKEPSPIVKFLVSKCKKLIRTSPSSALLCKRPSALMPLANAAVSPPP